MLFKDYHPDTSTFYWKKVITIAFIQPKGHKGNGFG